MQLFFSFVFFWVVSMIVITRWIFLTSTTSQQNSRPTLPNSSIARAALTYLQLLPARARSARALKAPKISELTLAARLNLLRVGERQIFFVF